MSGRKAEASRLTVGMGAMGGGCHPSSSSRGRRGEGPSVEFASHFVLNRRSPPSPSAAVGDVFWLQVIDASRVRPVGVGPRPRGANVGDRRLKGRRLPESCDTEAKRAEGS